MNIKNNILKIFLKRDGYDYYDRTNDFNHLIDFIDYWDKTDNEIFGINLMKTNNDIRIYLKNIYNIDERFNNSTLYFYKENIVILYNNNSIIFTYKEIKKIIDNDNDDNNNYECNICFETPKTYLNCHQCSFKYCINCIDKIKKNDINFNCVVCKYLIQFNV